MIYELSLVAKADLGESQLGGLKKMVHEVVNAHEGEVLIEDDWGKIELAQPTSTGTPNGHFFYFMYKANNVNNVELARRFRINEGVIRHMVIKLADEDAQAAELAKKFKCPYSKKYAGSVTDKEDGESAEPDKRRFARRKACWFTSNEITADWKDPKTYTWMINEFGKISPARITGVSRKHQRFATDAIKRARQIGLASSISNRIAQ